MLRFENTVHRYHCAIEDGDEVVLTGGTSCVIVNGRDVCHYSVTVTRYNIQGQATPLPSLNQKRRFHACGKFTNSNSEEVKNKTCHYKKLG